MRITVLLILFIVSSGAAVHGQGKERRGQDVLYLKNHWVLRGKLLKSTDSLVRIQTQDGSVYAFPTVDIDTVTREDFWDRSTAVRRGFRNFTELGPLIAGRTTINGVTTAAFSFQTFLGYTFTPQIIPGIGAGADLYATQTILPVFTSLRGYLARSGTVIPFYFGDAGYGVNITQNSSDDQSFRGGLLYAAGAGVEIPFSKGAGFLLSLGYRYQATSYVQNGVDQKTSYRRLALRAGFCF